MSRLNWSEEDNEECEAAAQEAWDSSTKQSERTDAWLRFMLSGEQAHRTWAVDLVAEALRTGAGAELKRIHDRLITRADVALGPSRVVQKRRTLGVIEKDTDGTQSWTQMEFDDCTLDQLVAKRNDVDKVSATYRDSRVMLDRLIALCKEAGAVTPREAAAILGTTVDDWIGRAA